MTNKHQNLLNDLRRVLRCIGDVNQYPDANYLQSNDANEILKRLDAFLADVKKADKEAGAIKYMYDAEYLVEKLAVLLHTATTEGDE